MTLSRICRLLGFFTVCLLCTSSVFAQTPSPPSPDVIALFKAAETGDVAAIKKLLAKKVAVDTADPDGWTALMVAASAGQRESVATLVRAGADVNAKSKKGETVLMAAVLGGKREIVELLLTLGADKAVVTSKGLTAAEIARRTKQPDLATLLEPPPAQAASPTPTPAPTPSPPTATVGRTFDSALVAYEAGRYDEAVPLLQDVVAKDPKHAMAWHFLGRTLEKKGDREGAAKAYQQVLDIQPTGDVADRTRKLQEKLTGKDGAPMVRVPAGEFMMGNSPEEEQRLVAECIQEGKVKAEQCQTRYKDEGRHRVEMDAFYLDKFEVTNRLFDKFVRDVGYRTTAEREGKAYAYGQDAKWTEVAGADWRKPEGTTSVFDSDRSEHPVVSVSWEDADAFCRWAGKRLPTEAEFEYANRAGTQTRYWWGDGNPGSRRVGNLAGEANKRQFPGRSSPIMTGYDDGYARTAPVGSFEPNPWGLYDLTGNAAEWTADWYDAKYYEISPVRNPKGPSSGQYRVLRGGSWLFAPQDVRSAYRRGVTPSTRNASYGFRCAQDGSK